MFPTNSEGTFNDSQLFACANARLVAGPPIAADDATRRRCGKKAVNRLPRSLWQAPSIMPCTEYSMVKNNVRGIKDAFTDSATATPGAPAVAKNKYKHTVPRISAVDCRGKMNRFGAQEAKSAANNVQHGSAPEVPPIFSPSHNSAAERKMAEDADWIVGVGVISSSTLPVSSGSFPTLRRSF